MELNDEPSPANYCSNFRCKKAQAVNIFALLMKILYAMAQASYVTSIYREVSFLVTLAISAMFMAESSLMLPDLLAMDLEMVLFTFFGRKASTERPFVYLPDHHLPLVDVFVACCGESVWIIMDTIAAIVAQDYPTGGFRVFVLDDGRNDDLRIRIKAFNDGNKGRNKPNVTYCTRDNRPQHYKAGNLNFGLTEVDKLERKADFFASVDADMIVVKTWLKQMLPFLVLDAKVALACPPQHFYNMPAGDPLCQSDVSPDENIPELIRDALGTARCSGSGWVASREAIDGIGRIPVGCLTEDLFTTAMLNGAGWKTVYVPAAVQHGIVPESYYAYTRQVMRWTTGDWQVARSLNFFLSQVKLTVKLGWIQRLSYMVSTMGRVHSFQTCAALLILPVALFFHFKLGNIDAAPQRAQNLLRFARLAVVVTTKLNEYCLFGQFGLSSVVKASTNRVWMAPYTAIAILKAFLPGSPKFKSTGSLTSTTNEQSATGRKNLFGRLINRHVASYMIHVLFAGAIGLYCGYKISQISPNTPASLVASTGALTRLILNNIVMLSTPVLYMIKPPTSPHRSTLLEVDHEGINRPKVPKQQAKSDRIAWQVILELFVLICLDWAPLVPPVLDSLLACTVVLLLGSVRR